jgi:hypothetical protein
MSTTSTSYIHTIPCGKCGHAFEGRTLVPPSPVSHLLGSNALPSEIESCSIKVSVSCMRKETRLLDDAILHFDCLIQKLQYNQQSLQDYISSYLGAVHDAPFRRLFRLLGSKRRFSSPPVIRRTGSSTQSMDGSVTSTPEGRSKQDETDPSVEWLNSTTFDDACSHCGFVYQLTEVEEGSLSLERFNVPSTASRRHRSRAIREVVAAEQKRISWLYQDISRVGSFLQQLTSERQALQECITEHEAVLSPARRLMPELWSEIFLLCSTQEPLEGIFLYDMPNIYNAKTGPLLFTQVCRAWRDISLSTPRLWTTVGAIVEEFPSVSQLALVNHWLAHSGDCPLTVYIAEYSFKSQRPHPPVDWSNQNAVHALVAQSRRWQKAFLRIPPAFETWESFSPIHGQLPILQKLSLHPRELEDNSWPEDLRIDVFNVAPQLNELRLDYGNAGSVDLPYYQLTNFHIRGKLADSSVGILHLIPCLRVSSLFIHTSHFHDTWLCALNLSTMSYWGRLGSGLSLLGHLTFPFLEHLELRCDPFTPWDHQPFLAFLGHSMCLLRRFSITSVDISAEQVSQILARIPSVRELRIDITTPGAIAEVVNRLADTDPPLLPRLLTFKIHLLEGYVPDFLIRFIHFRMSRKSSKKLAHIRYVVVHLTNAQQSSLDDALVKRLDEWCQEGLRLKIYTTEPNAGSKICYDSISRQGSDSR